MSATTVIVNSSASQHSTGRMNCLLTYGTVLLADFIALSAAGAVAVFARYLFHAQFTPADYVTFAPGLLLFVGVFAFSGLYPGVASSPIEEFRLILRASSIGLLLLIGSTFFLREGLLSSRIVLALAWALIIIFVPLSRRLIRGYCSLRSWWGIPTVVLGEQDAGLMMVQLLQGHSRLGLRPIAFLTDQSLHDDPQLAESGIFIGNLCHANRLAKTFPGAYAVLAMPNAGSERVREVLTDHADGFRNIVIIPDLFGIRSLSISAVDICGVLTLRIEQKLTLFLPQFLKRTFDLAIACVAAIIASPLLLLLCAAVKLSSPGPIFYYQRRIGKNRRTFKVWKFRTMVMHADAVLKSHLDADPDLRAQWERDHKLKRDPRVTGIGRFLRMASLDELPQLWNVITGDMSLVGPRPIVEPEIHKYGDSFRQYQMVAPGLTGLWQISGRNNTAYELRIRMDDYYVRNWSLSLDIYILMRTIKTILLSEGAY